MPIIVNTNVSSINAQRQLTQVNRSLDKSLERLASGLRINRAGDDAAGLAIADSIQSQVRGLGVAVRNATDGLSVVGTAEGTLTTQVGILQRMRELAVQSANDINSSNNRSAIQDEIEAQIDELTRLGNTTEFNGQRLLNGEFQDKKLQVGAYAGQTINITLGDFRASKMGTIAQTESSVDTYGQSAIDATVTIAGGGDLLLNGVEIGPSQDDGVSENNADGSAIAKAEAINMMATQSGVRAEAGPAIMRGNILGAGTSVATDEFIINGVAIIQDEVGFNVEADDADGSLRNRINQYSNETGVTAYLNAADGNRIYLKAEDGRNIDVQTTGFSTAEVGFANNQTASGTLTLSGSGDFTVSGTVSDANIDDLIGLTGKGTIAADPNKRVNTIDVTTQDGASDAIQIIDNALKEIADAQGQLGAITNRLENTISNLEISIENLSASESRIRDADFAKETANLTRAQIIQQSSISVLTQANLKPQAALSLLG